MEITDNFHYSNNYRWIRDILCVVIILISDLLVRANCIRRNAPITVKSGIYEGRISGYDVAYFSMHNTVQVTVRYLKNWVIERLLGGIELSAFIGCQFFS